MNPKKDPFPFGSDDNLNDQAGMSDAELERLMAGGGSPLRAPTAFENLQAGERVQGTVIEVQRGALLVELDRKTLGIIDPQEFGEGVYPAIGSTIQAEFVRYDHAKDLCILSIKAVHTEVAWEELRVGLEVEGKAVEATKGGLVLDIHGLRAFLPVSRIELERVEDLQPYLGRKLRCTVEDIDRAARKVVVSRRTVLEREREGERGRALSRLKEGDVLTGRVARITEHGAFINLGAVDGLLHISKMRERHQSGPGGQSALQQGQMVEVEVLRVDAERGRISLDFRRSAGDSIESTIASYKVGDQVTGWVSRSTPEGAILSIEEGLEAFIPRTEGAESTSGPKTGSVIKGTILSIDRASRRIVVKPLS
jgi:small subunit ribosomal protein S1